MTLAMAIGTLLAISITGEGSYNRLFLSAAAFSFFGLILSFLLEFQKYKQKKENSLLVHL